MLTPQRQRQREGPRRGDEPVGIPGFRNGFKISMDADRRSISVGPGICTIRGELIRIAETTAVAEALKLDPVVSDAFHWLYVGFDDPLVVARRPPVFSAEEFQDVHPEDERLVAIGCYYQAADGPLWGNSDFHSQPREVWVGSADWVGEADFVCDGVADEVEINLALRFQREVEASTRIRLTGGAFRCDGVIVGGLESILEGQGPRTVVYAQPLTGFQNFSAQVRSLRYISGTDDRVYGDWAGGIETTVLFAAGENVRHVHVNGELRVNDKKVLTEP